VHVYLRTVKRKNPLHKPSNFIVVNVSFLKTYSDPLSCIHVYKRFVTQALYKYAVSVAAAEKNVSGNFV